jgi:1-acyl-sn-glycerol-3-phosphate acyltransferase
MIRAIWAFLVLTVTTVGLGITALAVLLFRPGSHVVMKLGRLWSRAMLSASGVRVTYEGVENARKRSPCVFISNHQSFLDIWATTPVLPLPTRFVAKKSLFRLPVFGWCLSAGGFIPIDRKNRTQAVRSLEMAAEKIRGGRLIFLFAEGTRSRDGRLGPFKKGAFHMALRAGVPVVPVAISGTWDALPRTSFRPRPGEARVRFLPPVEVDRYAPDDIDGLMSEVRAAIVRGLEPNAADSRLPAAAAESR